MVPASILIVEDEPIVAKDIQLSLQRLGYRVPATATSGEEAICKAGVIQPDLILMDIVLKGNMDGIETTLQIRRKQDVPVIYLTAYADSHTLERAKVSSPAGYMLKPYQANELRTTIELALHRARHDRDLLERLRWIATTVRCIGEGIVTTDREGRLTFMNPAAETFTGWGYEEAAGINITALLGSVEEGPIQEIENLVKQAMAQGKVMMIDEAMLISKQGARQAIRGTIGPVIDEDGIVLGAVLAFHELGNERPGHHRREERDELHRWTEDRRGAPQGIVNLCFWCKRIPDASGEWHNVATFIAGHSAIQLNGGLCPACIDRCFPRNIAH
ncbi:MAG TPA: response regulator, partial [Nitrospira sp.]|nr:response regulator [Nitrospira sp.]